MRVHHQPLSDELPYDWNVGVYWDKDREAFCLQVIKRKGLQYSHGGPWHSKWTLFHEFSEYELGAIESVVYPNKDMPKIFSAGRFAKFIDDYKPLKPLAEIVRRAARIADDKPLV
jgi:hypothetical protein